MPKHLKKKKNAKNRGKTPTRPLLFSDSHQEYAIVEAVLGNSRFDCHCYDNKNRIGKIRAKLKRGKINRISIGSIVLVSHRDFETNNDKVDIIHVYTGSEVAQLEKKLEIPRQARTDASASVADIFEDSSNSQTSLNIEFI